MVSHERIEAIANNLQATSALTKSPVVTNLIEAQGLKLAIWLGSSGPGHGHPGHPLDLPELGLDHLVCLLRRIWGRNPNFPVA
jgi:hypothetical protein